MMRMTVGRRNLLERLARSRAARDLRRFRRRLFEAVAVCVWLLGWLGVMAWVVDHAAPAVARWLGWI